jgi:hypothetical protein
MCLIIHQPAGKEVGFDILDDAWKANSDGVGYTFINPERKSIKARRYMEYDKFLTTYKKDLERFGDDTDFLIHFRLATHGKKTKENVHPFEVDRTTMMVHNGIIHDMPKHDSWSDTKLFNEYVLKKLPENWLDNPYMCKMVEEYIGWSKVVFLTNNPNLEQNVYFLNKDSGYEYKDLWLSNKTGLTCTWGTTKVHQPSGIGYNNEYAAYPYTRDDYIWDLSKYGRSDQDSQIGIAKAASKTLVEMRRDQGLDPHGYFTDHQAKKSICLGCETTISPLSGKCYCFRFICVDCEQLVAWCDCKGWSDDMVLFDPPIGAFEKAIALETRYETTKREWEDVTEKEQSTLIVPIVENLALNGDLALARTFTEIGFDLDVLIPEELWDEVWGTTPKLEAN